MKECSFLKDGPMVMKKSRRLLNGESGGEGVTIYSFLRVYSPIDEMKAACDYQQN